MQSFIEGKPAMIKKGLSKKSIEMLIAFSILIILITLTLKFYLAVDLTHLEMPLSNMYLNVDGRMTIAYFKMIISGDWAFYDVPTTAFLEPVYFRCHISF
ncbi:MAG: hypothetical protein JU82_05145 [Sulfuricurvum sp. MLSB]|nr:MAG: hypothetical protein JU82_05145 [Sulfuricurvum sp. MLSB]